MGLRPLFVLFWLGACLTSVNALGSWEYVESPQGPSADENTPRQRVYETQGLECFDLEVVGPVDLQFTSGENKMVVTGVPGLLDQTRVEKTSRGWAVRLEPGLSRPPEGGRLTLEISLPLLEKLTLRSLASGDIKVDQAHPLEVALRDESRLTGQVTVPEIRGYLSWKSRGELKGAVGRESWTVRGESRLRVVDLKSSEARVTLQEGARLLISLRESLTGDLRRKAQLVHAQGQDTTGLSVKEESTLELLP